MTTLVGVGEYPLKAAFANGHNCNARTGRFSYRGLFAWLPSYVWHLL